MATSAASGEPGEAPKGTVRAFYNGVLVAESDDVRVVEGITYFPKASIIDDALVESPTTSRCVWKGKASYFHVDVGDDTVLDAAFEYENPWPLAKRKVGGRVGLWRGVILERA